MSMREYPTSGYVIPVKDLKKLLTDDLASKFDSFVEDDPFEFEGLGEVLANGMPDYFPPFEIYRPRDEDTVDEPMEHGEYYAIFDEDDLFERKMTEKHKLMNQDGLSPTLLHWSVWG